MRASQLANEGADGLAADGGRLEVELTSLGRRPEIAGFGCPLIVGFEVSTEENESKSVLHRTVSFHYESFLRCSRSTSFQSSA
jgi:hypothetical protein